MYHLLYISAFTKYSKCFLRIFNAFDRLLHYNKQNQCPSPGSIPGLNKHYLYPSLVTWVHFIQVAQGDFMIKGDIGMVLFCIHGLMN